MRINNTFEFKYVIPYGYNFCPTLGFSTNNINKINKYFLFLSEKKMNREVKNTFNLLFLLKT